MTIGRDRSQRCVEGGKRIGGYRRLAQQVKDGRLSEQELLQGHGEVTHSKVMTSGMNILQGAYKGQTKSSLQTQIAVKSRKRLCLEESTSSLPSSHEIVGAICKDHPELSRDEAQKCLNRTTGLLSPRSEWN